MDIAVTGASGHIGGVLVRELLRRGERVRALVREGREPALEGLEVRPVRGDLADEAALDELCRGAELVFHLASRIWIGSWDHPDVLATNVEGTRRVVAAVRRNGVRRLVHFSSIHALQPRPEGEEIDESTPLIDDPRAPLYDRTKALAQLEVQAAARDGLDAVIVNPCGVIGPYDFRGSRMGRFFLDLYHRRLPALVDGGFNWVDVRDVAAGAIAAAERGVRGEHYLLGGHWHPVSALAEMARAATGVAPPRLTTPMWLARGAAPVAGQLSRLFGREGQFTPAAMHALRSHRQVVTRKAETALGFQARPTEQTVRDTFAWFREAGLL